MKYHRHLFDKINETLLRIFSESLSADKVLEKLFKDNKKWGKRDRQFVAEVIYEIVRWRSAYEYVCEQSGGKARSLIDICLLSQGKPLPAWSTTSLQESDLSEILKKAPSYIQYALPEWLYQKGKEELGEKLWHESLKALNQPASVILRTNTLKTSRENLLKQLTNEGISVEPLVNSEEGIVLKQRANVFRTQCFQQGFFEVQDGASQQVGLAVAPMSGERIIDGCAGAGGKTLHMAALMHNKGKIISLDIYDKKLDELRRRARRDGVDIVETRWIASRKIIKRLNESADAVLLDVPCSGLGVVKRNPDTKWKLTPEKIAALNHTQSEILESYSSMVKPGGRLVYSTCSILPSENQQIVDQFLQTHPKWEKIFEKTLWPHETGLDGFYICKLVRL
ncbi:MAG: RsmB/NOP family class I SAM-dependent RNA methyltransferase [Bdellovibrionaceae bacterium]|nr:RsmB/NOP family class I SAM-dependent RNA methyltransferase [Pseudobdellovibrionaceae bacterium]